MLFFFFVAILVYILYPEQLIFDLVVLPVLSLTILYIHEELKAWNHNRKIKKKHENDGNV